MLDPVGAFRTTMAIENVAHRGEMRTVEDALVDTGSEFTWVPRAVLEAIGIAPERRVGFIVATAGGSNGQWGSRWCTPRRRTHPTSWFSPSPATWSFSVRDRSRGSTFEWTRNASSWYRPALSWRDRLARQRGAYLGTRTHISLEPIHERLHVAHHALDGRHELLARHRRL